MKILEYCYPWPGDDSPAAHEPSARPPPLAAALAQARDRLLRREAVPLADALASARAKVDWSCEGQADWSKRLVVALGAVSRIAYEKTPPKYVAQKPAKRTVLDAQSCVLKID